MNKYNPRIHIRKSDVVGAKNFSPPKSLSKTIGSAVRGFKIGVTKWFRNNTDKHIIWQRNYYEIIIRDESSRQHISEYIPDNPIKGSEDKFFKH